MVRAVHLLVLALLAATPGTPVKLAASSVRALDVPRARAELFGDHLAQQLSVQGLRVTTRTEVQALLGFERQKQLLGCDEDSSCVAELAGGLGVEGLVLTSVARVGEGLLVNVRIVSARDGSELSLASGRLRDDEAVLDFLQAEAPRLAREVYRQLRPGELLPSERSTGAVRRASWIPAAAGVGLGIAGGVLYGLSQDMAGKLRRGDPSIATEAEADALARTGSRYQTAGLALGGVAVAALVTAGVLYLAGGERVPAAQVSLAAHPGGVFAVWTGVLP
jgi:hypothetical protein